MADNYWISPPGGSTDWSVGANWSGGTAPVDTEDLYIVDDSADVLTNLSSTVDPNSFTVGGRFRGAIATAGSPLTFPTVTVDVTIQAETDGSVHLDVGTCPKVYVNGTGSQKWALYLVGGTVTELWVQRGMVRVGAATVTTATAQFLGNPATDARLLLDSGSAVTTLRATGGQITDYGGAATVTVGQYATYSAVGTSQNQTTVTVNAGGLFRDHRVGGTLTNLHAYGRVTTDDHGRAKTNTNTTVYAGGVVESLDGSLVLGTTRVIGGVINGPYAYTQEAPSAPSVPFGS